jgi:hypothetical protein
MAAALILLKWALDSRGPLAIRFSFEVLTAVTAYVLVMMTFHRKRISILWDRIKSMRNCERLDTAAYYQSRAL